MTIIYSRSRQTSCRLEAVHLQGCWASILILIGGQPRKTLAHLCVNNRTLHLFVVVETVVFDLLRNHSRLAPAEQYEHTILKIILDWPQSKE